MAPAAWLSREGLRIAGSNAALALFYAWFATAHARAFLGEPRASLLIVVVMEGLLALLVVVRTRPVRTARSLHAWLTTLGGTLMPLLLRPVAGERDLLVGQAVQVVGALLALASVLSLRTSFGLLPAVRTLRVDGAYRWVRHPIYAAYTLQGVGYLLSNRSLENLVVVGVALAFQVLRIHNEERMLGELPEYREYAQRTRWRLVPGVY